MPSKAFFEVPFFIIKQQVEPYVKTVSLQPMSIDPFFEGILNSYLIRAEQQRVSRRRAYRMQPGFFDQEERLAKLEKLGDPPQLDYIVDWQVFRLLLEVIHQGARPDASRTT